MIIINEAAERDAKCSMKSDTNVNIKVVFPCVGIPIIALQWHHNERDGVPNHQPHDCLLNRLFKAQIKENI